MSNDTMISVEGVSKLYRLGQVGTGTLSHDLNRWWHRIRGKDDPYKKLGQANNRAEKGDSQYVWALKDINFEVKQGEVLGIIGKNGAGKSTLLKLLSKVTSPSEGRIKYNGRIASLLEVGTGFHPELTGRENVFLNGSILGMTKKEIRKKFDEIVDFSGVERYVDTPVKRYSSGMYVRLAFAVAAFLEPEILIVDEVLAVGDAEFQKKCIGRMKDVSNEGRTVLFVSHNMAAISSLCSNALLLSNGTIKTRGSVKNVVDEYLDAYNADVHVSNYEKANGNGKLVYVTKAQITSVANEVSSVFKMGEGIFLHVNLFAQNIINDSISIGIAINNVYGERIIIDILENYKLKSPNYILVKVPTHELTPGVYKIDIGINSSKSRESLDLVKEQLSFEILKENTKYENLNYDYGYVNKEFVWEIH